jgi:hypothetical protein
VYKPRFVRDRTASAEFPAAASTDRVNARERNSTVRDLVRDEFVLAQSIPKYNVKERNSATQQHTTT